MRGLLRAFTLSALMAATLISGQPSVAQAQISEGWYGLYAATNKAGEILVVESGGSQPITDPRGISVLSTSDGDPLVVRGQDDSNTDIGNPSAPGVTLVGYLYVLPHPDDDAPYVEHWLLFPQYDDTLAYKSTLSIRLLAEAPDEAEKAFDQAAIKDDVRYRQVVAMREELADSSPVEPSRYDACSVDPDAPIFDFRTIWQRSTSSSAEPKLVGFIHRAPPSFFTAVKGEEQWCVTGEYRYPTPANGVAMELRPASRADLDRAASDLSHLALGASSAHGIHVWTEDSLASQTWRPGLGRSAGQLPMRWSRAGSCALSIGHPSLGWVFGMGLIGIIFLRRRATRVGRQRS